MRGKEARAAAPEQEQTAIKKRELFDRTEELPPLAMLDEDAQFCLDPHFVKDTIPAPPPQMFEGEDELGPDSQSS